MRSPPPAWRSRSPPGRRRRHRRSARRSGARPAVAPPASRRLRQAAQKPHRESRPCQSSSKNAITRADAERPFERLAVGLAGRGRKPVTARRRRCRHQPDDGCPRNALRLPREPGCCTSRALATIAAMAATLAIAADDQRQCAIGADPAVAHDLELALACVPPPKPSAVSASPSSCSAPVSAQGRRERQAGCEEGSDAAIGQKAPRPAR